MAVCTEYNRFWNTSRERRTAIPRRIVGRPEEVRTDKTQRNAETAHHVGPPQRSKSARAAPNGEGRIPIHRAGARIRNPTPAISRAALIKPGTGIKHQPAPRRLTPDPCFHPSGHSLIRTETVARHPDELRPRVLTPFRAFADLDSRLRPRRPQLAITVLTPFRAFADSDVIETTGGLEWLRS